MLPGYARPGVVAHGSKWRPREQRKTYPGRARFSEILPIGMHTFGCLNRISLAEKPKCLRSVARDWSNTQTLTRLDATWR